MEGLPWPTARANVPTKREPVPAPCSVARHVVMSVATPVLASVRTRGSKADDANDADRQGPRNCSESESSIKIHAKRQNLQTGFAVLFQYKSISESVFYDCMENGLC